MVAWFVAEAAVDIHNRRAIWQIAVSAAFILIGIGLFSHGWRKRNKQHDNG